MNQIQVVVRPANRLTKVNWHSSAKVRIIREMECRGKFILITGAFSSIECFVAAGLLIRIGIDYNFVAEENRFLNKHLKYIK